MKRTCFVFTDTLKVGGCLVSGFGEGDSQELGAPTLATLLPTQCFAGIVCVADD